ncbi:hypothetical protein ECG_00508 [Echinococcus granulosus]|nr:hypothetical protein ECG_00508 [Echinococcus granulosus]
MQNLEFEGRGVQKCAVPAVCTSAWPDGFPNFPNPSALLHCNLDLDSCGCIVLVEKGKALILRRMLSHPVSKWLRIAENLTKTRQQMRGEKAPPLTNKHGS